MHPKPLCLIIDSDRTAVDKLSALLQPHAGLVWTATQARLMQDALQKHPFDCIFIRIDEWDEYRMIARDLSRPPATIVFLSGQCEKCAAYLSTELDFHLQPPYYSASIDRLFARRSDPAFQPRPLDFFFLKNKCRYQVIYFSTVQTIHAKGRSVTIQTDTDEYTITGSLSRLQERLPPLFHRINRNWLINCYHNPVKTPGRISPWQRAKFNETLRLINS
jgi:DNA-binding LytR/AlgR family response regulator